MDQSNLGFLEYLECKLLIGTFLPTSRQLFVQSVRQRTTCLPGGPVAVLGRISFYLHGPPGSVYPHQSSNTKKGEIIRTFIVHLGFGVR